MIDKRNTYVSPLSDRYGSDGMKYIFSDHHRHGIWRRLWLELAIAQKNAGINITDKQINEIHRAYTDVIHYDKVAEYEAQTHHDVMAHIMEFSDHCPTAKNIIHLGATSCYVTDNADIILMREGLSHLLITMDGIIRILSNMAMACHDLPITGRTHLQRAQLTTIGKRICMWLNDIDIAYDAMVYAFNNIKLLGCKGATGSQASFKTMFGNYECAQYVDKHIAGVFNIPVTRIAGQTYTRLYDSIVANALSLTAQAMCKMATDIRLMACFGEMYEKFGEKQIGSSAMPYKRNPINCEKICGLSRHVICNAQNMAFTASTQWLERTLDDSSNRRITIPELFITTDEILKTALKVIANITINADKCEEIAIEHSNMASLEDDIIKKVLDGGNRQEEHANMVYSTGSEDAHINTGFASEQVQEFCTYINNKYRWRQ